MNFPHCSCCHEEPFYTVPDIYLDSPRAWGRRQIEIDRVLPADRATFSTRPSVWHGWAGSRGRFLNDPSLPPSYEILAEWKRERVVYYQQRGGRQGHWLLVTNRSGFYRVYAGYYGSCSACDPMLHMIGRPIPAIADYFRPTGETRSGSLYWHTEDLHQIVRSTAQGNLNCLDYNRAYTEINAAVCFLEDLPPHHNDILYSSNAEIRRVLLERMGNDEFIGRVNPRVLDRDGRGQQLLAIGDMAFVRVFCDSTGREYILRVPPQMRSIQQARAWTFGKEADEFRPEVET